jgi:hypothetical protein
MVQKDIAARRCGLPAAIRASSVGSNICNAVGTLGKNFQLACGHAAKEPNKDSQTSKTSLNPQFLSMNHKKPNKKYFQQPQSNLLLVCRF